MTDRMSRPRLSVPSGCSHEGGCSDAAPSSDGLLEANHGANVDRNVTVTRITRPMPPKRVWNRRRRKSSEAATGDCRDALNTGADMPDSAGIEVSSGATSALRRDADARIEPGVEQIDHDVHGHDRAGDQDDDADDHLGVAGAHRFDHQRADAG